MGIPENIKELRKNLKMTQKDLAKITGLSIGTIQGYEQGRYEPKIETLRLLMNALSCNYEDIIDEPLLDIDEEHSALSWLIYEEIPAEQYDNLLTSFNILNTLGRNKAIEQVELLTKIPEYQRKYIEETATILNAAHERTDIETTEEMKKHDDDIMNDENF